MFCKRVIISAIICAQFSGYVYGMNNNHDIELGYQGIAGQQLAINANAAPNLSQKLAVLKEKISDFRTSVALKNTINMGVVGASYICTGLGVVYHNMPVVWTGYGLFVTSMVISNVQNFSSYNDKEKLLELVNQIED